MRTENEGLVRGVIEALFNQKRVDLISTLYAPDCQGGSPEGPFDGCTGFRAYFEKFRAAFPDFRFEIDYTMCEGDRVAAHYLVP
jgi:predicted ester cyclase